MVETRTVASSGAGPGAGRFVGAPRATAGKHGRQGKIVDALADRCDAYFGCCGRRLLAAGETSGVGVSHATACCPKRGTAGPIRGLGVALHVARQKGRLSGRRVFSPPDPGLPYGDCQCTRRRHRLPPMSFNHRELAPRATEHHCLEVVNRATPW